MYLLQAYQAELLGDHNEAEVVVRTPFANCVGPQICLSGLWQHLVTTERHLWLNLSNIKIKDKTFLWMLLFSLWPLFAMQLIWLLRDFRNQRNKQLHSRNSSPALLISPGLLSGSSPKHLSWAWLIMLPHLNNGDTGSALNLSLRSVKRIWGPRQSSVILPFGLALLHRTFTKCVDSGASSSSGYLHKLTTSMIGWF